MKNYILFVLLFAIIVFGINTAQAEDTLGQQAYAILENRCLNCHGAGGSFTENLLIADRDQLIAGGSVVPNNPGTSELYLRLISTNTARRMPLGQPALSTQAIATIQRWIAEGAPDWTVERDINFITTDTMLDTIQSHLESLQPHERPYARYFTLTHLYNAGETADTLHAYRNALSKLVNSLSWGHDIIKPHPINPSQTLLYIDLRHYEWDEWDTRADVWKHIEHAYPYIEFTPETEAGAFETFTQLREDTGSTVPFIHADWFLATASLPPLYHDILRLPDTDGALEAQLGINVQRNIQQSPGIRVARAGIVKSGVSKNNRVVERHTSVYGAYWKSYDFAGSVGAQNIRAHPLSFKHDGGEIVFNLPNGLQAYYISDEKGNRIEKAPTDIVSNPAASDPAVRNGLSCIGCHTQGMKTFEDVMRTTIELTENPNYDKTQALRLYVGQNKMDKLLEQDTEKYRQALVEATGQGFEEIEPVHRAHEIFEQPLDAADAAAALGLKTEALVQQIQDKQSLQSLGLTTLLGGGTINRDAWTAQFADIVSAIHADDSILDRTPTRDPTGTVAYIPDPNLLTAIANALGKPNASTITIPEMETLTHLIANDAGIRDLTGLEKATRLQRIELRGNAITDLTPLAGLIRLNNIKLRGNNITDVSPLANLKSLDWLGLEETHITDLSSLSGLVRLKGIGIDDTPVTDLTPLATLPSLEGITAWRTRISDFSVLASARRLKWIQCSENRELTLDSLRQLKTLKRLEIVHAGITNIDALSELTHLETLKLWDNQISDLSPLRNLKHLKTLYLSYNLISDLSPLAELTQLKQLSLEHNIISDVSPLANLTNLTRLDLRENGIADFSPLAALAKTILYFRTENNPGSIIIRAGGDKIVGPWLWMIAATGVDAHTAVNSGIDYLAEVSSGVVTELRIATDGAIEGTPVGNNKVWTRSKISSTESNNINTLANATGLGTGDINQHVAYGSILLHAPREQETKMLLGSDDTVKVWLNGTLVHKYDIHRGSSGYQDQFDVTLKEGVNVLLVAVYENTGGWSGFFGFAPDAEYTVMPSQNRFSLDTDTTQWDVVETFTLRLNAAEADDLAGWQADIHFDPAILKVNNVTEGTFLKQNAGKTHFRRGTIDNTAGRINGVSSTRLTQGGVDGEGTLLSVTFTLKDAGETQITLHGFAAGTSTGEMIIVNPTGITVGVKKRDPVHPPYDVNEDGIVDATDILLVIAALGQEPPETPRLDVNGDGVVNAEDLVLVVEHLGEGTAPAAASHPALPLGFSLENVERTLNILRVADDGTLTFKRAIENLEELLARFVPENTVLLHNYPNPFNPETWIPYELSAAADVSLTIYATDGKVVRILILGHQPAGYYTGRSRAAYWDGRNSVGEPVASGVYFYTLTAGDFRATRKMLIVK